MNNFFGKLDEEYFSSLDREYQFEIEFERVWVSVEKELAKLGFGLETIDRARDWALEDATFLSRHNIIDRRIL